MKSIFAVFLYTFVINVLFVSSKISGGPRGRFDKVIHRRSANNHHVSAHHAHYSYHPPSHINFVCRYCSTTTSYPVYHGLPPTYVYKYRESGTRFGDLMTGLALLNLGRVTSEQWHSTHYYTTHTEERCSLQVIDHAHFEETRFPCFMMSSFMEPSPSPSQEHKADPDAFLLDIISSQIDVKSYLNETGSPLKVNNDQQCVLWHNVTLYRERNHVPCALLKEYAETMKPSGVPVYIWLPVLICVVIIISLFCQCCWKKKSIGKEDAPLNDLPVVGYCSNH